MVFPSPCMIRSRAGLRAFAFVLALAATAQAATPNETAGLKRFDEGKKAYDAGRFADALAAFQDSLALLPSPNTRLYIARCFRSLDKPASAYTAYRLAAKEAADRLAATNEKRYQAARDAATSEGSEIEAKVPRLTVAVPSDAPDGTTVRVDDADLPKAAWGVAVETDPGDHVVTATAPRREPFRAPAKLAPGEQKRVDVTIARLPTGALALVLKSRPNGMEITLDDQPLDATTWDRMRDVDAGHHKVTARAPGYDDFTWEGDVADGGRAEVEVKLAAQKLALAGSRGTPKWLFFTVAGAAVVAEGVATVVALHAKSDADAEKAKDPLLRSSAKKDEIRTSATEANVLFIGGGVLAAGAVALAFTTAWKPGPETGGWRSKVTPWVTVTGAGLATGGSF